MFPFCHRTIIQCRIKSALPIWQCNLYLLPCITEVKFIHFFYWGGLSEDDLDLNNSGLITIVILFHGCHFSVSLHAFICLGLGRSMLILSASLYSVHTMVVLSIRSNGCHPPILIHSSLIVPVDTTSDIKLPSHLDNTMKGGRKNALFIK